MTTTSTPTPTAAAKSLDDPIDALTAWNACAVLSQAEYQPSAGSALIPYDPSSPPTQNADGAWTAIVGYPLNPPPDGAKSVVVICTVSGTLGAPKLISWSTKDI